MANAENLTGLRIELLGGSRLRGVVVGQQGLYSGQDFYWAGGGGGGKNSMIFQPLDVCLVDGSFPKQKKTIQMMRLPNMMVSPTQVLDDGCFYCLLSYLKKRCKPLFSISKLKIHSLNKMGGMFIYWPENIQYSSGLDKICSWSFKIIL